MKNSKSLKLFFTSALLLMASQVSLAQSTTENITDTYFVNPVFLLLLSINLLLALVIFSLSGSLRKMSNKIGNSNTFKSVFVIFSILFLICDSELTYAQELSNTVKMWSYGGLDAVTFYALVCLMFIQLGIIFILLKSGRRILIGLGVIEKRKYKILQKESAWSGISNKLTDAVPIDKESEIIFSHEYDGIRELDNSLPPWWLYMFYVTILTAFIYVFHYHILGTGKLSIDEYKEQLETAAILKQEYLERNKAAVDENNVIEIESSDLLTLGKEKYISLCAACHGNSGEGGVGPNLTDEYWLHGGDIKSVFKIIKYGVPAKGMISWQSQLKPDEMQNVASYILTLQGSNPENAKEPQGELFKKEMTSEAVSDSTLLVVSTDSIQ
ncbi:MAG TPA: cbb3-type cytochrome c oxidase N-terminal domain-containing protein [Bacteroidia bacterium]|nr:cbb3-type cytochrome c oxidase N-terminal domain-containing protein [Bacteroidia bacterium]